MMKVYDIQNDSLQRVLRVIPVSLRTKLSTALNFKLDMVQDIVLRTNRPVCVYTGNRQMYLTQTGCLTDNYVSQNLVVSSPQDVSECFNNVCGYSVYSHISEIREGFITIKGGHRVGITGTAVISSGAIHNIRDVSTLSIRISRQIKDCAKSLTAGFAGKKGGLLICGSPCSGKTTVIRDMARLLSTQYSSRVSLVDTRGELASVCQGIPQNDIGMCDVMDSYPRVDAIDQAVRSLSPQYVICDEIGNFMDANAILHGINSGVRFVATVHANNREELLSHKNMKDILATGAFDEFVFLSGRDKPCIIKEHFTSKELSGD